MGHRQQYDPSVVVVSWRYDLPVVVVSVVYRTSSKMGLDVFVDCLYCSCSYKSQ